MELQLAPAARWRDRVVRLAVAVALFAAVTALRFAVSDGSDGTSLLYSVPIAVLAVAFGVRGGVGGAIVAIGLYATWVEAEGVEVDAFDYWVRGSSILTFGGLAGVLADQRTQLGRSNTRWFEMSNDLLVEASPDGFLTRLNDRWEQAFGWTRAELLARPISAFVHPDDRCATATVLGYLATPFTEVNNFEHRWLTADGRDRWLLWNARSDRQRIYAVARDITERKALEAERERLFEQVELLARTDPLTGLPNRRAWDEEVARALAWAERSGDPLALAVADLDNFKLFNDTHGHPAGDALLAEVARIWRGSLRGTDVLARYGGEEFGVLLPNCPPSEAVRVLDLLRLAVPAGQRCSIGVAHWDREEHSADLVARADAALYEAKRLGRDRVVATFPSSCDTGPVGSS